MMHSGTPETGQKSRFFDLFSPRKCYKLSLILFLILWSVLQTNSSTEEAITSQSSTLPVAFRSGFLPISPKTGFFMQNVSQKGFQRPFWYSLRYVVALSRS